MLPALEHGPVVLRPLTEDDAPAAHRFLSDTGLMRYWSSAAHADLAHTREYITGNCVGGDFESWAITLDGGEALGWVNLREQRAGVAEIGYILARQSWGRGIAKAAVSAAIAHGFTALRLRRIAADVDPDNAASIALLERLGFRLEGRLREEWQTHIGVRDSLIFGLLAREWREVRAGD